MQDDTHELGIQKNSGRNQQLVIAMLLLIVVALAYTVQSRPVIERNVTVTKEIYKAIPFIGQCHISVCPLDDPLCLSIRIFNYSYSMIGSECQLLEEVCFDHGNLKCQKLKDGCTCTANNVGGS